MSLRQIPAFALACWQRLRRVWAGGAGRSAPPDTPPGDRALPANPAVERGDARTRFWNEFRAGQREAEARATRRGA